MTAISGKVKLMQKVGAQAEKIYDKSQPVNATGAMSAIVRVIAVAAFSAPSWIKAAQPYGISH